MITLRHHIPATLLCLALGFSGCTRRESGQIRIQFSIWGSVEQMAVEREIVADFEAAYPGIKVDLLPVGARYNEKIQAMMVGRVAPDVLMVEMTQYFEWASRGVLLDVTTLLEALAEETPLMPVPHRAFLHRGRAFAIPVNCHGPVMFYNRDVLDAADIRLPPAEELTWEWIESVSPHLSRRAGTPDAPTDYALILPSPMVLLWAWGASLFDNSSEPTRVTVHSPEAAGALEFIRRMIRRQYAVPPDIAADQGTFQLFRDGRIAFYFDGRWRTPDFAGQTDFNWDVVPMPAGPARRITQHGGTGLAIAEQSRHPEAAKTFLRFYASRSGAERVMRGGRNVPVYRELAFGDEFLSLRPPESMRHFAETMEAGASETLLYAPGSSEVASIVFGRVEQAIARRGLPLEHILSGMEQELNRWLSRQPEACAP